MDINTFKTQRPLGSAGNASVHGAISVPSCLKDEFQHRDQIKNDRLDFELVAPLNNAVLERLTQ